MKKNTNIVMLAMIFVNHVYAEKEEFSLWTVKDDKRYLGGFIQCLQIGLKDKVEDKELPKEDFSLSLSEYKYLLRHKNSIICQEGEHNVNFCSRNKELLADFIENKKSEELKSWYRFGYQIRSKSLSLFPMHEDDKPMVFHITKEGDIAEKRSLNLDSGDMVVISLPCAVLGLHIKDNNVSNEELGYVASVMLAKGNNVEIENDRYAIKLTICTQDSVQGKTVDISDFLPRDK